MTRAEAIRKQVEKIENDLSELRKLLSEVSSLKGSDRTEMRDSLLLGHAKHLLKIHEKMSEPINA
jgi:hypothetical protein